MTDTDCISADSSDLKTLKKVADAFACCVACKEDADCKGWSYNENTADEKYKKYCFLKADACVGGKKPTTGVVSGMLNVTATASEGNMITI